MGEVKIKGNEIITSRDKGENRFHYLCREETLKMDDLKTLLLNSLNKGDDTAILSKGDLTTAQNQAKCLINDLTVLRT